MSDAPAGTGPGIDKRLIDLESRLAFVDENVDSLSNALAAQQRRIDQLERLCRVLLERVRASGDGDPQSSAEFNPADERPPHY